MEKNVRIYLTWHEKITRAQRKEHQEKFVRKIIAEETGIAPERIRIGKTGKGKPFLPEMPHLHFNLSDSGPYTALCCASSPVGIDLERIAERPARNLLDRWFREEEKKLAQATAFPNLSTGFIYLWTCKESLLKNLGCGLCASMKDHPVKWRVRPDGKPQAFAVENGSELSFTSFLVTQGNRIAEFSPETAAIGDYILTVCHENGKCLPPVIPQPDCLLKEENCR